MKKRAILIVLDSAGIGYLPDAADTTSVIVITVTSGTSEGFCGSVSGSVCAAGSASGSAFGLDSESSEISVSSESFASPSSRRSPCFLEYNGFSTPA